MTRLFGVGMRVVSLAAMFVLTEARGQNAGGHGQDEAAIRQLAEQYAAGWNEGNAGKAAAIFADQAIFVDDGGKEIRGRSAIEQDLAHGIGGPLRGTSFKATVDGFQFLSSNVAVAYGTSDVEGGPGRPEKGHYVVTCQRNGSAWKVVALGTGLDVTH